MSKDIIIKKEETNREVGKVNMSIFNDVHALRGLEKNTLLVTGEGDDYVPLEIKILWFRSLYPTGRIETKMMLPYEEILKYGNVVYHATIYSDLDKVLSEGTASCPVSGNEAHIEIAESKAISRALKFAGFTWSDGNFSNSKEETENKFLPYVNGEKQITIDDEQAKKLFEVALKTVIPANAGYSEKEVGKTISDLPKERINKLGGNYGVHDTGDTYVNSALAYVYRYTQAHNNNTDSIKETEAEEDVFDNGKYQKYLTKRVGELSKLSKEPKKNMTDIKKIIEDTIIPVGFPFAKSLKKEKLLLGDWLKDKANLNDIIKVANKEKTNTPQLEDCVGWYYENVLK